VILGGVATATVTQPPPGNEPLPQPSSATELGVATARGFPTSAPTLAGLFANFNGGADAAIDPVASAQLNPGQPDAPMRADGQHRAARGGLQERLRLVQRHGAGHQAVGRLPNHPDKSHATVARRDQLLRP
jgi:hypothetical protein